MGPYLVVKMTEKEVYVDWDGEEKHHNLSQVVSIPPSQGN